MLHDESRISAIVCGIAGVMLAGLLIYGLTEKNLITAIVWIVIIMVVFLNVFSLRLTVAEDGLRLSYGIGLITSTIPFDMVESTEVVPNSSLTWIYNPASEHVLRLRFRGGGSKVIGIGEPRRLMEYISRYRRG